MSSMSALSALSALLFLSFLHGISALVISIDGNRGNDAIECIRGQFPCYSLKHVADSIQSSTNITIEIISSALSLQGSVVFTGINELIINGHGAIIKCESSLNEDMSGIIFKNLSNVQLNGFVVEHCGLLYEEKGYRGKQAILFTFCNNIQITNASFNNNYGVGLVLHNTKTIDSTTGVIYVCNCTFTNNSLRDSRVPRKNNITLTGGGLRLIQNHQDIISMTCSSCYFWNNSATSVGGALFINFGDSSSNNINITNCSFIGNKAITSGGAIGITVYIDGYYVTAGFHIFLESCVIASNEAIFGGGVAILIPHLRIETNSKLVKNKVLFSWCKFTYNKAVISSVVDINGNSQRGASGVNTVVKFSNSQFISNIAGIKLLSNQNYSGQLCEATVSVVYFQLVINGNVSFINNTGTAVYLVYSRILVLISSLVNFTNNTGECGGAMLLSESSTLEFEKSVTLYFLSNAAKIGGAICTQSTTFMQYTGTCFLQNQQTVGTFYFINNKATTSVLGDDIFSSTLKHCVQLYGGTVSSLFLNNTKMGTFNFLPKTKHSIATAPATVLINNNELDLVTYPGIPYTMNVTQRDEFNNSVTDLENFSLFATLLNNQKSSLKIDLTHFIANNYTMVFKGSVGDKGKLVLQTKGYSARLLVNVTLHDCPPGYIFNDGTCYCSRSSGFYYYGVTHCLENKSAVVNMGLWAGYIGQDFATADCVTTSLCKCGTKYNQYKECVLPLDCNLLNDRVCAPHKNGTLCSSCITNYTVYFHSPSYHCHESTHCRYGLLLYVFSEIIPVTCIFLVILFFNINLTSGGLYSFIFYSQIVNNQCNNSLHMSYNGSMNHLFNAFKMVYGIFDLEILEIDCLSFCLFKDATIMDLMLIKYLTTLYALLLIIITILVLKFNSIYCCIRFCHKYGRRNIRGSIVNALTAFLILCYFHCLVISFRILVPSYVMGEGGNTLKIVPLYNGDLAYMSDDHLKYVIPAIICLVFIILPPPIILLLEPLLVRLSGMFNIRRNAVTYTLHRFRMKLKPFLDSFQGCFKDKYRYFAGLFFLYRILLVLFSSVFTGGGIVANTTHEVILFLILLLHCLCRPFEKKSDNNIDSFLLINLLMINLFIIISSFLFIDWDDLKLKCFIASLQLFLMSLPLIYMVCFAFRYCCKGKCLTQKEVDNFDDDLPARLLEQPRYNTFNN